MHNRKSSPFFNIKNTGAPIGLIKTRIYLFINILLIYYLKTFNSYSDKLYKDLNKRSFYFILIIYLN
jgi:hypothetical protein